MIRFDVCAKQIDSESGSKELAMNFGTGMKSRSSVFWLNQRACFYHLTLQLQTVRISAVYFAQNHSQKREDPKEFYFYIVLPKKVN